MTVPTVPTVGVEEELGLTDGTTGLGVNRKVPEPFKEVLQAMLEVATPGKGVDPRYIGEALRDMRNCAAAVARGVDANIEASGMPIREPPEGHRLSPGKRYSDGLKKDGDELFLQFASRSHHVHAMPGEPDEPDEIILAILEMQQRIPIAAAIAANSPICNGRFTGYASARLVRLAHRVSMVPEVFEIADTGVKVRLDCVAAYEKWIGQVHSLRGESQRGTPTIRPDKTRARLAARLNEPNGTCEPRYADVAINVQRAELNVLIAYGLIVKSHAVATRRRNRPDLISAALSADLLAGAARAGPGLKKFLVPGEGLVRPERAFDELFEYIREPLEAAGVWDWTKILKDMWRSQGSGAHVQVAALKTINDMLREPVDLGAYFMKDEPIPDRLLEPFSRWLAYVSVTNGMPLEDVAVAFNPDQVNEAVKRAADAGDRFITKDPASGIPGVSFAPQGPPNPGL